MKATVGPAAVAEAYRTVFLSEESGTLEVRTEERAYTLAFERGLVSEARVRFLAPDSVPESAAIADVVRLAFSCSPVGVDFRPSPAPGGETLSDVLRTVEYFISGIRSMEGFDSIREALLEIDRRVGLRTNPAVPLQRLTLKPIHGFVMSRLDGSLTPREIVMTVGQEDESEALRFLYALALLGSVAFDPAISPGVLKTEAILRSYQRDFAREEAESAFIRETYNAMLGQNPYEILSVEESTPLEEIRRAYEDRRKALAPDRFLEKVRERFRTELAVIDAKMTETFLTLQPSAPAAVAARESSSETLDLEALSLRREFTKTDVAAYASERERLAEAYYLKAKKLFSQGSFYDCIQYCTQAILQSDQPARFHFLLAEAQSRNPDRRWQRMAEQSFLQAIKLDPWNADYLVTLGQFYRKHGFTIRARRQFERALQLQPSHEKAGEELSAMA